MPVYEYLCIDCGVVFERIQPLGTEMGLCRCGKPAKKLISAPFVYRDKRFEQVVTDRNHNQWEIRTKAQLDRFMKKNGLVSKTPLDKKHLKTRDFAKESRQQAEKLAQECVKEIRKKGAMDWVQGKVNPDGADKAALARR